MLDTERSAIIFRDGFCKQRVIRVAKFKPGQSGNPSGRPADLAEIVKLARSNSHLAFDSLLLIATKGQSESARIAASTAILDRAYGKPSEPKSPSNERSADQLTRAELEAAIAETDAAISALEAGSGAGKPDLVH